MRNNRCCFFCRPSIFFSSFSTSFRDNENHWPQLIHVSGVECQIDRLACFAAYFSSFPKENAFQNLEEDLWTINRKTEFSDFSLTLTTSIIFPDFFKNSLTFPLTDSNPVIKIYHKNWIRIVCLLRLSKRSSILAAHMFTSRGSLTYVVIW